MRADRISWVTGVAFAAAVAAAAPSLAQTTDAPRQARPVRPPALPAARLAARPPVEVTVRKRSFLDPGTETKPRSEHYTDYIYSPTYGLAPRRDSTLFTNAGSLPFFHDRMPFPNCLDLPGFCQ